MPRFLLRLLPLLFASPAVAADPPGNLWVILIAANKYDLSINRYKEVEYQQEAFEDPKVILQRLKGLEQEILADLDELEGML